MSLNALVQVLLNPNNSSDEIPEVVLSDFWLLDKVLFLTSIKFPNEPNPPLIATLPSIYQQLLSFKQWTLLGSFTHSTGDVVLLISRSLVLGRGGRECVGSSRHLRTLSIRWLSLLPLQFRFRVDDGQLMEWGRGGGGWGGGGGGGVNP